MLIYSTYVHGRPLMGGGGWGVENTKLSCSWLHIIILSSIHTIIEIDQINTASI